MNLHEAKTMFDSHIRKILHPMVKSGTMLVLVSKETVIHVYTDEEDDKFAPLGLMRVYILEKERHGDHTDSIISVRKFETIDVAKLIQTNTTHMVSMLNSESRTIQKLMEDGLLNHRNTIDPYKDTQLKCVGPAHKNFVFYTHSTVAGAQPIKSEAV